MPTTSTTSSRVGTPGRNGPQRFYSANTGPMTVVSPRGEQTPTMSINIPSSSVYKIVNNQPGPAVFVEQEIPAGYSTVVRQTTPRQVAYEQFTPLVREVSVIPQNNYSGVIKDLQLQVSGLTTQLKNEIRSREQVEINLAATRKDLQLQIDEMQRGQNDMLEQVKDLVRGLNREKQDREALEVRHGEVRDELENLKAHLTELDFFATNELQKALHLIESRGNIQVNFDTGDVRLLRPITFQPRTTKDTPTAIFTQPDLANAICQDLSEVMKLFDCPIQVEGHTKGGESEFWQTLADARARVVVGKMVEFGADRDKITSCGRPGNLGLNETRTVVHLNLPVDQREQAMRKRSGLISLG